MAFNVSPSICVREPCFGCRNCAQEKIEAAIKETDNLIYKFQDNAFEQLRNKINLILKSTMEKK